MRRSYVSIPRAARPNNRSCSKRRVFDRRIASRAQTAAKNENAACQVDPHQQCHDSAEGSIHRVQRGEMPEVEPEQCFRREHQRRCAQCGYLHLRKRGSTYRGQFVEQHEAEKQQGESSDDAPGGGVRRDSVRSGFPWRRGQRQGSLLRLTRIIDDCSTRLYCCARVNPVCVSSSAK
jgi:hypothetical protein